ncbi:MAG: hypothetical protein ABL999_07030 [Pyrinomonadaceae bacterium]
MLVNRKLHLPGRCPSILKEYLRRKTVKICCWACVSRTVEPFYLGGDPVDGFISESRWVRAPFELKVPLKPAAQTLVFTRGNFAIFGEEIKESFETFWCEFVTICHLPEMLTSRKIGQNLAQKPFSLNHFGRLPIDDVFTRLKISLESGTAELRIPVPSKRLISLPEKARTFFSTHF